MIFCLHNPGQNIDIIKTYNNIGIMKVAIAVIERFQQMICGRSKYNSQREKLKKVNVS